jgi:hypothetical protein
VPAPRHGDEGRAKDEDGCRKPFHVAVRALADGQNIDTVRGKRNLTRAASA